MARFKYVCRRSENGGLELIPIENYNPQATTQILTDTIEPTWHPVTGNYCSSRTGMIKIAKEHGLEELGNDRIPRPRRERDPELREKLIHAYDTRNR